MSRLALNGSCDRIVAVEKLMSFDPSFPSSSRSGFTDQKGQRLPACSWALNSKSMGYGERNNHLTIMIVI
jgi:hypothetical protein